MQSKLIQFVSVSLHLLSGNSYAGVRMAGAGIHIKARQLDYQGGVQRFPVPDDKVSWSVDWPEYQPVDYTAPVVLKGPVWADPDFRCGDVCDCTLGPMAEMRQRPLQIGGFPLVRLIRNALQKAKVKCNTHTLRSDWFENLVNT